MVTDLWAGLSILGCISSLPCLAHDMSRHVRSVAIRHRADRRLLRLLLLLHQELERQ